MNNINVAICNDLVTGCMGERVLWDFMLESIPNSIGIDQRLVGYNNNYAILAHSYINKYYPNLPIIIQNATFIDTVDPNRFTIAFLQDNLRAMGSQSWQQENNLNLANICVTNSHITAASYKEWSFEIIPVGVDEKLFKPLNKQKCRQKLNFKNLNNPIGIFVGAFNEVKGWSEIQQCIEKNPNINWILVSKHNEQIYFSNAQIYNQISQDQLVVLLNSADFFIVGSSVETQCLAAIEAGLCNIPIVMKNTGIFHDLSIQEKNQIGVFGDDLLLGIETVLQQQFSPRQLICSKNWTVKASMEKWNNLINKILKENF